MFLNNGFVIAVVKESEKESGSTILFLHQTNNWTLLIILQDTQTMYMSDFFKTRSGFVRTEYFQTATAINSKRLAKIYSLSRMHITFRIRNPGVDYISHVLHRAQRYQIHRN